MTDLTVIVPAEVVEQIARRAAEIALSELDARADRQPPEWMGVERAAEHLGCSSERLRKLIARRKIPFHQEGPRCRVSFNRRDLDNWMRAHRSEPHERSHER